MAGEQRQPRGSGARDPEPTKAVPRSGGRANEPDDASYYSRTYRSSRLRRPSNSRGGRPRQPRGGGSGPRRPRPGRTGRPRRRGPLRKVLGVLLTVVLIYLITYAGILAVAYTKIDRVSAFEDYSGRPAETPGQDWLLVGSDSREGLTKKQQKRLHTGHTAGRRADTMMLLHIPEGGGKATLISLPRDSWVPVPGYGREKLNTAYRFGGPKLAVRTVETVTGIRLDHYMEVGFGGFASAVDAVGGVEICVKRRMHDPKQDITFKKGCQEMDGRTGLAYVRSRYNDPRGGFGRVERQREFLGALFAEASSPATLLNPFRAGGIAFAGAEGVSFDERDGPIDMFVLFWTMRKAAGGGVKTMTVPHNGSSMEDGQSVVRWDRPRALELFEQLSQDEKVTVKGGQ